MAQIEGHPQVVVCNNIRYCTNSQSEFKAIDIDSNHEAHYFPYFIHLLPTLLLRLRRSVVGVL